MTRFLALLVASGALAQPVIPTGLDAYRMWDRWAYQRIGVRAYMRSTYDRRGGNVMLDVARPGILYFARYNHWHGSPWHYEVAGADHIVRETIPLYPGQPVAELAWSEIRYTAYSYLIPKFR
jgi:hypothetical protein